MTNESMVAFFHNQKSFPGYDHISTRTLVPVENRNKNVVASEIADKNMLSAAQIEQETKKASKASSATYRRTLSAENSRMIPSGITETAGQAKTAAKSHKGLIALAAIATAAIAGFAAKKAVDAKNADKEGKQVNINA